MPDDIVKAIDMYIECKTLAEKEYSLGASSQYWDMTYGFGLSDVSKRLLRAKENLRKVFDSNVKRVIEENKEDGKENYLPFSR